MRTSDFLILVQQHTSHYYFQLVITCHTLENFLQLLLPLTPSFEHFAGPRPVNCYNVHSPNLYCFSSSFYLVCFYLALPPEIFWNLSCYCIFPLINLSFTILEIIPTTPPFYEHTYIPSIQILTGTLLSSQMVTRCMKASMNHLCLPFNISRHYFLKVPLYLISSWVV